MNPLEGVLVAVQATVALVFVGAGAAKLANIRDFTSTMSGLGLPERPARATAHGLALIELALGLLALAGIGGRVVTGLVFAMTVGFVLVTALAARWRPEVQCRCFGSLGGASFGQASLLRSALLAVAAGVVLVRSHGGTGQDVNPLATTLLLAVGALFAVCCAAAAGALEAMGRKAVSQ